MRQGLWSLDTSSKWPAGLHTLCWASEESILFQEGRCLACLFLPCKDEGVVLLRLQHDPRLQPLFHWPGGMLLLMTASEDTTQDRILLSFIWVSYYHHGNGHSGLKKTHLLCRAVIISLFLELHLRERKRKNKRVSSLKSWLFYVNNVV